MEREEDKPVITRIAATLFPKSSDNEVEVKIASVHKLPFVSKNNKQEESEEQEDSLPKIRVKAEIAGENVQKFATAQGAAAHLKVLKIKRIGLTALHKTVSWLATKK